MNSHLKMKIVRLLALGLLTASFGSTAIASDKSYPISAAYKEECGSCHIPFPAGLLSAASWRAVMSGLDKHFGTDASIDPAKAKELAQFLEANSAAQAKYGSLDAKGRPLLRITEGSWFRREHRDGHDGITAGVWKLPAVNSPVNCVACHRGAESGSYAESDIRIPRS